MQGVENDLAQLAARGVTILFASGDQGNGESDSNTLFPSWPASSPWVTAVGATAFTDEKLFAPERAPDFTFTSGGGFSVNFEREPNASWQSNAVGEYLMSGVRLPSPSSAWDRTGRATPDVSALGEGLLVFTNGVAKQKAGTSAATPVFAALMSLLNEARLQRNMSCLWDPTHNNGGGGACLFQALNIPEYTKIYTTTTSQ